MSVCEVYLASIILSENGAQNINVELMVRADLFQAFPWYLRAAFSCQLLTNLRFFKLRVKDTCSALSLQRSAVAW